MAKYHIGKNDQPGICDAKKKPCPLGGDAPHFSTKAEAVKEAEKRLEKRYGGSVTGTSNLNRARNEIFKLSAKDRAKFAKSKNTNPRVLDILSEDKDDTVKEMVARNPNTSPSTVAKMVKANNRRGSVPVVTEILLRKDLTSDMLEDLSENEDIHVRGRVAGHPNTSAKVLEKMSKDRVSSVRFQVGRNTKTPENVLLDFAVNGDDSERAGVASNEAITADMVKILAKDSFWLVKSALASNESTPEDILRSMAGNSSPEESAYLAVAGNKSTPKDLLEDMSKSKSRMVRDEVAKNKGTPTHVLMKLLDDDKKSVSNSARKNLLKRGELSFSRDFD